MRKQLIKIAVVGDSVGKTSLISRFIHDDFHDPPGTYESPFRTRSLKINGDFFKLQIWDDPDPQSTEALTGECYTYAQGIILMYDVTDENSFQNIPDWIRFIQRYGPSDVKKVILGNKCEMTDERHVTTERGEQLAKEYGIKFMETSVKENINVKEAFEAIVSDVIAQINPRTLAKEYGVKSRQTLTRQKSVQRSVNPRASVT